jgi:gluconolactonase
VVKSDGSIYFTDPNGAFVPEQWDLSFAGVFRVSADLGTITVLVDDFLTPNGLAFSPDESILYINTRGAAISALSMSRRTAR